MNDKTQKLKNNLHLRLLPIITFLIIGLINSYAQTNSQKSSFDWSDIRINVKDSIIKLDKVGVIMSQSVGIAGIKPQQWNRQNWLINNLTEKELIKLTNYPSGTVKAIAYEGLIKQSDSNHYEILKKALSDTLAFVYYQSGCNLNEYMLSSYIINFVSNPNRSYTRVKSIKLNLSENEKKEILDELRSKKLKKAFYKKKYLSQLE